MLWLDTKFSLELPVFEDFIFHKLQVPIIHMLKDFKNASLRLNPYFLLKWRKQTYEFYCIIKSHQSWVWPEKFIVIKMKIRFLNMKIFDLWQGSSISWRTNCQQYFVCFQARQIGIISHGLFWQLTNHLHTTDKSVLMFGQRINKISVHTHRLKNSIKLKRAVIETMAMNRIISMHTPGINVHLPDSMEMIVRLAKTFFYRVKGGK